jgi:hypothetical protein
MSCSVYSGEAWNSVVETEQGGRQRGGAGRRAEGGKEQDKEGERAGGGLAGERLGGGGDLAS